MKGKPLVSPEAAGRTGLRGCSGSTSGIPLSRVVTTKCNVLDEDSLSSLCVAYPDMLLCYGLVRLCDHASASVREQQRPSTGHCIL